MKRFDVLNGLDEFVSMHSILQHPFYVAWHRSGTFGQRLQAPDGATMINCLGLEQDQLPEKCRHMRTFVDVCVHFSRDFT